MHHIRGLDLISCICFRVFLRCIESNRSRDGKPDPVWSMSLCLGSGGTKTKDVLKSMSVTTTRLHRVYALHASLAIHDCH